MAMRKPTFLVLCGDGINCERETAAALELAGAAAQVTHVNDVLARPALLDEMQGMAIPGGFSFGDELGSGQILALKIRHGLGEAFARFVEKKKPVIGICNGFQVLVKLGLLPFPEAKERVTALAANDHGSFMDRWVELHVHQESVCLWTKGLEAPTMELPVRHGEGRIVFKAGEEEALYKKLKAQGQIPLTYGEDINGSYGRIAGLTDPSGVVLGLMPHPEAHVYHATYRMQGGDVAGSGDGLALFENMVRQMEGRAAQADARRVV